MIALALHCYCREFLVLPKLFYEEAIAEKTEFKSTSSFIQHV